jgi:hypothetical protein
MKNIKYILGFLTLASFLITSCDESELYPKFGVEPGQASVSFVDGTANFAESASVNAADGSSSNLVDNTYEVRLVRVGADISASLSVAITATVVYAADTDFGDAGADASSRVSINDNLQEIVFPANSSQATFIVQSSENLETQGDILINFTIASVSSANYQIGVGSGAARSTSVLTVIDDDCPIDIPGTWVGIYEVSGFVGAPGAFNEGFAPGAAPGLQVELVLDESDPLGVSATLKATASNALLTGDMPLTFVTCPETVIIGEGLFALAFNQNGAPAAIGRTDEPSVYGNGTYSPDGSSFSIVVGYGNTASGLVFDEFLITFDRVE